MAAQFIAEEGLLKGTILELSEGDTWTIGRDPESCQLVLQDPKASRQHAVCKRSDEGYLLENLSQTNPTSVNGVPLTTPYLLQEGDIVKIGNTLFRFTLEGGEVKVTAPRAYSEAMAERRESPYETIFQEMSPAATPPIDLKIQERWVLKVISGPQAGAEFSMGAGKAYVLGNDSSLSDIVFYDLSVSRKHARILTSEAEECLIEDLESRNGTLVDGKPITKQTSFSSKQIVTLGTTSFIVIDRQQASETIYALSPMAQEAPPEKPIAPEEMRPSVTEEELAAKADALEAEKRAALKKASHLEKSLTTSGGLLLAFTILGVLALIAIGTYKLFTPKEAFIEQKDVTADIDKALVTFPGVTYTYNKSTGTLFLVGHVLTPIDKSQLQYNLQGLTFISQLDDNNVVVDQLVWQEMNSLIAKNPSWMGVNMYANKPGHFILTGYLKTTQEASSLTDYINRNFPFVDRLENKVVVEQDLIARIHGDLFGQGLNGVAAQISNGEVTLTGFIPSDKIAIYQNLLKNWKTTTGIRVIKSYVVNLSPDEAVVNLTDKYKVTGYAKSDDVNVNVIINGRILTRGDNIDGMTITSIQPDAVYLEKDGLKFKINYTP